MTRTFLLTNAQLATLNQGDARYIRGGRLRATLLLGKAAKNLRSARVCKRQGYQYAHLVEAARLRHRAALRAVRSCRSYERLFLSEV